MTPPPLRWHIHPQPDQVAAALAARIVADASRAIAARGAYTIVLPGGATPRRLFAALRDADAELGSWHVYFTDERCVPPDDPERNDTAARSIWLDRVAIPSAQIHSIPAELGADAGADAYSRQLAAIDVFDTTLLGLGDDGHTASLFPGRPSGERPDTPAALAVHGAQKPPRERVTLSTWRLAAARSVAMLVTGAGKRHAVASLGRGDALPATAVARAASPRGGMDVWLDAAAAADVVSAIESS